MAYKNYKFSSKLQIKYDIYVSYFMTREHIVCVFSNMIFGLRERERERLGGICGKRKKDKRIKKKKIYIYIYIVFLLF